MAKKLSLAAKMEQELAKIAHDRMAHKQVIADLDARERELKKAKDEATLERCMADQRDLVKYHGWVMDSATDELFTRAWRSTIQHNLGIKVAGIRANARLAQGNKGPSKALKTILGD